jgi:hypothetical protein
MRRHKDGTVSLYRDGRAALRRASSDLAIAQLAWEVNRGVVEEAGNRLLLHAAATEQDGKIVVLAGPEGSGKSTLAAALVCSGLRYVTDEAVPVELSDAAVTPYPKLMALRGDSLRLLQDVWSGHVVAGRVSEHEERLVPAEAFRRDAVAPPGGIARVLVVLSKARPDVATTAERIPRAEAAIVLAEQAFNFREFGPGRLDAIAGFVRSCDCYKLELGDLEEGCRLVLDLLDAAGGAR